MPFYVLGILNLSGNRHRSYTWNKRANLELRVSKKNCLSGTVRWKKGGKDWQQQTEHRKPFSIGTSNSVLLEFRAKLRNCINQKALKRKPNKFFQISDDILADLIKNLYVRDPFQYLHKFFRFSVYLKVLCFFLI